MQKRPQILRNQKGFTLIEIISVLIILGILSAVAMPKYIALQDQARASAAQSAIAEIKARLSVSFGSALLASGGTAPANVDALLVTAGLSTTADSALGDFNYTLTNTDTTTATIAITKVNGEAVTVSDTWTIPN